MRVTNRMMTENAIGHLNENIDRLNTLAERVSSGKQFRSASDNPSAASASLVLRSTLKTTQAYLTTAQNSDEWMSATEFAFKQMSDLGTRAITLAKQGLSDTLSGKERRDALGTEMTAILENAVDIANSSHQGNYLFAGFKVSMATVPFTLTGAAVTYSGDTGSLQREIGPNQTITVNVNGDTAFTPLFDALIDARDALNTNNAAQIESAVNALSAAMDTLGGVRTTNGARQRQLRTGIDRIEKTQIELKSLLTQKEDVNLAEAISLLQNQESTYKTVLEVAQRTISALNLFDYLR